MKKIGYIIAFKLKKGLTNQQRTIFFRELYGYIEHSQYSKYLYTKESIFGKKVRYFRPARAVIVTRKEDVKKILKFLRKNTKIYVREIFLTLQDIKKLY